MDPINNHSQEFTIPSDTNVKPNESLLQRAWTNFVNLLYWPSLKNQLHETLAFLRKSSVEKVPQYHKKNTKNTRNRRKISQKFQLTMNPKYSRATNEVIFARNIFSRLTSNQNISETFTFFKNNISVPCPNSKPETIFLKKITELLVALKKNDLPRAAYIYFSFCHQDDSLNSKWGNKQYVEEAQNFLSQKLRPYRKQNEN